MEGLGINVPVFLVQIVNFGILFALLYFAAFKPIMGMLEQRSAKVKESMDQAEIIRQKMAQIGEDIKVQMDKARKEGQTAIAEAARIGERVKEEARKEARDEAELLITRARAEIEREREGAIQDLREEFVDVAIAAAQKVVKETLDKEKHRQLIENALESTAFDKEN